jgi:hypothetical protein
MAHLRLRDEPYTLLRNQGVPCSVWFEDAIARYDVPTVVFDLYLLVPDIDQAAHILCGSGWTIATRPKKSDSAFSKRRNPNFSSLPRSTRLQRNRHL